VPEREHRHGRIGAQSGLCGVAALDCIRDGIDARIQKVHTDRHVYQQGLLIWVIYMRRCGHTEGIEAFTVTAEDVFTDFIKSDAP
jgi:hypothetical protein